VWQLPAGSGPEDVAVDLAGRLVAGGDDGQIWRWPAGADRSTPPESIARTGGRPLGIEVDPRDGSLVVCDAYRGLLRVREDGSITDLARTAGGLSIVFANNAAIAADGSVYFSDSSSRYPLWEWRRDIIERRPNGRVLRYDPTSGQTTVIAEDLYFPNGVALTPDESAVLVVETTTRQMLRIPTGGGEPITLAEFPSYPDNMSSVGDGTYWIAFPSTLVPRLENGAQPTGGPAATATRRPVRPGSSVALVDNDGTVLRALHGPAGRYQMITGVRQVGGVLWLGSLTEPGVARVAL
jgi:sugar lactone lactonase YvrE